MIDYSGRCSECCEDHPAIAVIDDDPNLYDNTELLCTTHAHLYARKGVRIRPIDKALPLKQPPYVTITESEYRALLDQVTDLQKQSNVSLLARRIANELLEYGARYDFYHCQICDAGIVDGNVHNHDQCCYLAEYARLTGK